MDAIEPSTAEQGEWSDNTRDYVQALLDALDAANARADAAEAAAKTAREDALREAADRMYPQLRSLISRTEAANANLALIGKEPRE